MYLNSAESKGPLFLLDTCKCCFGASIDVIQTLQSSLTFIQNEGRGNEIGALTVHMS